ncbi:MAG: response regulator [Pseudomonadota bacterium]
MKSLSIVADFVALRIRRDGTIADLEDVLATVRRDLPTLRTLIVVDSDGIIRNDTRPDKPAVGVDVADRAYFVDAVANPQEYLQLGEAVTSRIDGRRAIPMSRAVTDNEGNLIAVVTTSNGVDFFARLLLDDIPTQEMTYFLYEPDRGVLVNLDPDPIASALDGIAARALELCNCRTADVSFPYSIEHDNHFITIDTVRERQLFTIGVRSAASVSNHAMGEAMLPVVAGTSFSLICAGLFALFLRQEREIRLRDQKFSEVASNIPGVVFHYTLRPDGTDRIDNITKGCELIWEMTAEEIGRDPHKLWEMVVPEERAEKQRGILASATQLEPWSLRWTIRTPSGVRKVLQGRGRPERLEDGSTLWTSVVLDITDLADAEDALKETQEMVHEAQKREAIGQLSGGLAHDFNNFLAVIRGNAELLDEMALDAEASALTKTILQAADQSADLTRRLLLLSRRAILEPSIVTLNASVQGMEALLRRTFPETIEISYDLDQTCPSVFVDPAQLESAILNLAINARDAMPAGGKLMVQTSCITMGQPFNCAAGDTLPAGAYAVLTVSDTGIGMAPNVLEKALDPYFTTKQEGEGSGLGLSVVRGFVKQSGGAIELHSTPYNGAVIKLFFPIHASAPPVVKPEEKTFPCLAELRVLLVEDQAQVRNTMAKLLNSLGCQVIDFENGARALEYVQNNKDIDLVVSDVVMPERMSGPQLIREVRTIKPGVPAIFISGYCDAQDANLDEEELTAEYLGKPVSRSDIVKAMNRVLEASVAQKV